MINSQSNIGLESNDFIGDVEFSNVTFTYPSRSGTTAIKNLSFTVKQGQTVALVGTSGSGKSTCVQLLQRFYDPDSGSIIVDGKKIQEYNLRWLRQRIGVVSQEPILFNTTIRENILFGRDSATDEDIYRASEIANAHDFISCLPDVSVIFYLYNFHFSQYRGMKLESGSMELHYLAVKSKE